MAQWPKSMKPIRHKFYLEALVTYFDCKETTPWSLVAILRHQSWRTSIPPAPVSTARGSRFCRLLLAIISRRIRFSVVLNCPQTLQPLLAQKQQPTKVLSGQVYRRGNGVKPADDSFPMHRSLALEAWLHSTRFGLSPVSHTCSLYRSALALVNFIRNKTLVPRINSCPASEVLFSSL